jgi:hypothetical protein
VGVVAQRTRRDGQSLRFALTKFRPTTLPKILLTRSALLIIGQAVARVLAAGSSGDAILSALGMTPASCSQPALIEVGVVAAAGALLAGRDGDLGIAADADRASQAGDCGAVCPGGSAGGEADLHVVAGAGGAGRFRHRLSAPQIHARYVAGLPEVHHYVLHEPLARLPHQTFVYQAHAIRHDL